MTNSNCKEEERFRNLERLNRRTNVTVGVLVVLVVVDCVVQLLRLYTSELGDGILSSLWDAIVLLGEVLFMWTIIGIAIAGLAWLLVAGTWRVVEFVRSTDPFHHKQGLLFGVWFCLFLLAYVVRYTHPSLFLDTFWILAIVFDVLFGISQE